MVEAEAEMQGMGMDMTWKELKGATRAEKIGLMQLSVVRTLQCLVKGEALVSLCPGHAAITSYVRVSEQV